MGKSKKEVKGWQVASGEVRVLATEMGFPDSMPLPEVMIVDKTQSKHYLGGPQIQKDSSGLSPSGYFITVPEEMLEMVNKDSYILGPRVEEDIKHELAHYVGYVKLGEGVGRDKDAYKQAIKEVKAELRSGTRHLPRALALQTLRLSEHYGLVEEEAFETISKVALSLGVSNSDISKAGGLLESRDFESQGYIKEVD